jgi:hypothetical protein
MCLLNKKKAAKKNEGERKKENPIKCGCDFNGERRISYGVISTLNTIQNRMKIEMIFN